MLTRCFECLLRFIFTNLLNFLQSLCKINNIDSASHELFARIVDFAQRLKSTTAKGHSSSEKVIATEFPKLMGNLSLSDFIESTFNSVSADPLSNFSMRTAVSKAIISAQVGKKEEAVSLILDSKLAGRGVNIESCREALQFVGSIEPSAKEKLKMLVIARFPFVKDL